MGQEEDQEEEEASKKRKRRPGRRSWGGALGLGGGGSLQSSVLSRALPGAPEGLGIGGGQMDQWMVVVPRESPT